MANWDILKASIAEVIKTNDNQEITGDILKSVLINIVSTLGEHATFAGVAKPNTQPGWPDGPVFYIAVEPGAYSNFENISVTNHVIILINNLNTKAWESIDTGLPNLSINSLDGSVIADTSITGEKIAQGAITRDHIENGAIDSYSLADDAVTTDKIAQGAVTTEKIAQGAVTAEVLADAVKSLQWSEVQLTDIDALSEVSSLNALTAYKVKIGKKTCGYMFMTMDDGNNQIAQYMITSMILPDGGYDYNQQSLYVRTFSRKGSYESAQGTWSTWRKMISTFNEKLSFSSDGRSETYGAETGKTIDLTASDVFDIKALLRNSLFGGTINLTSNDANYRFDVTEDSMKLNDIVFFIVSDSKGSYPSLTGETAVNVREDTAKLWFAKGSSFGVNVGDFIVGIKTKIATIEKLMCRVIPVNDAKPANGNFLGSDGIESVWDKTQINKIPGIESTSNNALPKSAQLPSLGETNMNNALHTGVYPWCTLGRPEGATGAFTCVVKRSSTADFNGYYTVEQTAYGRESELGQVYKRLIFIKDDSKEYGDWIRVDLSNASVNTEKIADGAIELKKFDRTLKAWYTGDTPNIDFVPAPYNRALFRNKNIYNPTAGIPEIKGYTIAVPIINNIEDGSMPDMIECSLLRLLPRHYVRNKQLNDSHVESRYVFIKPYGKEFRPLTHNYLNSINIEYIGQDKLVRYYSVDTSKLRDFILQFGRNFYDASTFQEWGVNNIDLIQQLQSRVLASLFYWGSGSRLKYAVRSDTTFTIEFIIAIHNPSIGLIPIRVTLNVFIDGTRMEYKFRYFGIKDKLLF